MAVGLGCFFIMAVRAVQANLLAELDGADRRRLAGPVLIDIQRDQVAGVRNRDRALRPPRSRGSCR